MGLGCLDYHYFDVYTHRRPFGWRGERDHGLRTSRRNLYNGRVSLTMGFTEAAETSEASYSTASWGVIEQVKHLLCERDGFSHQIFKYNAFMDQNSNASTLLFDKRTIDAIEGLVDSGRLPDGHATVLFMKMVHAVYSPIGDPNFGAREDGTAVVDSIGYRAPPFACHVSQWAGLYMFRYWRAFIKLDANPLTLGDHFISLEHYTTLELTVHGCTNWLLVVFREKAPRTPWRLAAPTRNVATTTPMEGTFAAIRYGKIGHHNSVNCNLKVCGGRCSRHHSTPLGSSVASSRCVPQHRSLLTRCLR